MENEEGEIRSVDKAWTKPYIFFRSMFEVSSVRYMNISRHKRGHLYGEIIFDPQFCDHGLIYHRSREHPESVRADDTILLTGPDVAIEACNCFFFDVALTYVYDMRLLADELFTKRISWSSRASKYDTPYFEEIKGLYGSVIVNYVVFENAVPATVEVTFIKGDEEYPAKLCGNITARNSDFMPESFHSVLFRKTSWDEDEDVDVRPGQPIPLSKSSMAVNWDSYLIVEVDLYHSLNGGEIAKGIAEFEIPSQPPNMSEQNISGKYGEIRVKVVWQLQ